MPNVLNAGVDRLDTNVVPATGRILPSIHDQRIFGIDISQFNGTWRFDQTRIWNDMYPVPVEFVVIRSGQFDTEPWDDVQFVRNMEQAKSYEFPRATYHVLGPNRPALAQAEHIVDLHAKTGLPEGFISLDVQLRHQQTPYQISKMVIDAYTRLGDLIGDYEKINVYTAKWFTDQYMQFQTWMRNIRWWIARWMYPSQTSEHPGLAQSDMPFDVSLTQCDVQQTTSNLDGALLGAGLNGTQRCDGNRWQYPRAHFNKAFGLTDIPDNTVNERLNRLEAFMGAVLEKQLLIKDIL